MHYILYSQQDVRAQTKRNDNMPVRVITPIPAIPDGLFDAISAVDVPTLGHFLGVGFTDPGITRVAGVRRLIGRAVTVRVTAPDSALVHRATEMLVAGDVLLVDTGGDRSHAAVGSVVATAVATAGGAGIVVDGPATDTEALAALGISVYSRGTSVLTTKLLGLASGGINVPIVIGGVAVLPGYIVAGDADGVLIADPDDLAAALPEAQRSDAAEPDKLRRVRAGEPLSSVSVAGERLRGIVETPSRHEGADK
jgi:4-hydroxy-4-methyl-2-oxoglutarate aldolase